MRGSEEERGDKGKWGREGGREGEGEMRKVEERKGMRKQFNGNRKLERGRGGRER